MFFIFGAYLCTRTLTRLKSCPKTATYRSLRFFQLAAGGCPSAGTISTTTLVANLGSCRWRHRPPNRTRPLCFRQPHIRERCTQSFLGGRQLYPFDPRRRDRLIGLVVRLIGSRLRTRRRQRLSARRKRIGAASARLQRGGVQAERTRWPGAVGQGTLATRRARKIKNPGHRKTRVLRRLPRRYGTGATSYPAPSVALVWLIRD